MYKKILVPLDGSQLAEAVLRHVEALAGAYDAEVILARVVVPAYILVAPEVTMLSEESDQVLFSQAQDYLKGIAGELAGSYGRLVKRQRLYEVGFGTEVCKK